jgi:hypothetical protein
MLRSSDSGRNPTGCRVHLPFCMKPHTKLAALALATFCASPAVAACLLDDYSITGEFACSELVALGTVISEA